MALLHLLTKFFCKQSHAKTPQRRSPTRLLLENLEDRITPSTVSTYTNVSVQLTPNLTNLTATETVTATVTPFPTYNPATGQTTPIPPGAGTPTGAVQFNLNNLLQSVNLNADGQATATFTIPLLSILNGQTLRAAYTGGSTSSNTYHYSSFGSPVYLCANNLMLPSTITFGQLTPEQNSVSLDPSTFRLHSYNTAAGETENFGLFAYNYIDPGVIISMEALGHTLPGYYSAFLGAFSGIEALNVASSTLASLNS